MGFNTGSERQWQAGNFRPYVIFMIFIRSNLTLYLYF